jgi:type IV pilus assembly protein PilB
MTKGTEVVSLQAATPARKELEQAIVVARQKGISPIDLFLQKKQYSEDALAEGFANWLKLPRVRIASLVIDPDAVKTISEKVALKYQCLPLKIEGQKLVMAMANPADYDAIQDVQFMSGYTVQPVVAMRSEILDGIQEMYNTDEHLQDFLSQVSDASEFSFIAEDLENVDLDQAESRAAADTAPVIKMCNLILQEAIRSQASDVHLEPTLNCLQVRMRVDGVLREYIDVPKWLTNPLVSRIKILAALDIAERRLPQDGRVKVKFQNKSVDLRISTLPTHFGEKIVIRVLGTMAIPKLEEMGFSPWQYSTVMDCLNQPQGMILLTGPTGSGKTTTLYSMIANRRSPEVNIITVEDPIEYQLEGINQVQVNTKAGLTFASTLRSILRQDPDVILIGEIRDLETAEIAFQASITGHLVLSTLHTNDSFGAIVRLLDLGVDRFVLGSSLSLVVAQRLARRICLKCKEAYTPPEDVLKKFRIDEQDAAYYHGQGCLACGKSGFSGRMGIYEMLRMSGSLKELIRQKANESAMRRAAAVGGTHTLFEDGVSKAREGLTSPEEILRVIEVASDETFPCPKCNAIVSREFKSCPYCMTPLRNLCQACGQDLKPEWSICPYCSTPVSNQVPAATVASEPGAGPAGPNQLPASNQDQKGPQQLLGSSQDQKGPAGRLALPQGMETPVVKHPKVVVADDDPGIIKVVEAALKQLPVSVEVFTASDGAQALEEIERSKADMAILDVKMPNVDGFQVCEKLRQDVRTAFLPILMLTANSDQENRTKGYLVGTDDFMSKPFALPDFLARVTRLLRRTYGI